MTFFALQNMCNAHTKSEGGTPHYRVVSDAMLNKAGRIRYLLCDGLRRIPISAKTGDKSAQNLGFFNLKRYDAVTVINPEIRGDAQNPSFGIDEKTHLTVRPFAPHSQGSPGPLLQAKSRARREKKSEATELSLRKDKSGKRKIPYRYRLQEKDRSGVMSSDVFKGLRQKEL